MLRPPWFPATYLGRPALAEGRSAAVIFDGHVRRVVEMADEVDVANLEMGDQVFLGESRNLLIAKSEVKFERWRRNRGVQAPLGPGPARAASHVMRK